MSRPSQTKYDDILKEIEIMPRDEQVDILFYLLKKLIPDRDHERPPRLESVTANPLPAPEKRPRKRTLQRALGLLATDGSASSDEDIERWLDDHRQGKYG